MSFQMYLRCYTMLEAIAELEAGILLHGGDSGN